jgi:hypothetical protein
MKRAVLIIGVLSLLIFASCSDTSVPDPAISGIQNSIKAINDSIGKLTNDLASKVSSSSLDAKADKSQITTFQDSVNSAISKAQAAQARADEAFNKASSIISPTIPNYAADIADLKARLTAAETKLAALTIQPTPTPTPTGTVVYSVVNPQQFYQFTSGANYPVTLRIFNNTSVSRYVRPNITLTTYGGSSAGATSCNVTVVQNSQGQALVTFQVTPSVNTILCQGITGGVSGAGEYLISPGTQLDYTVMINISTANPVLWNLSASGSDRPISQ